jgi:two-component system, NarL family, nitrate/nitrite response regulator NarL
MNIVIADSHTLCREALGAYLMHADQSIDVRGAGDYASLMESLGHEGADLLLLDTALPGLPMIGQYTDFSQAYPSMRIGLMISPLSEEKIDLSGMQGYFPKTLSSKSFLKGIYQMMEGECFVPEIGLTTTGGQSSTGVRSVDDFHLTVRERQVLGHLLLGATNKDIARSLDLQVVTVKLHVRGICRKIGAKNRTQAALIAQENGWYS